MMTAARRKLGIAGEHAAAEHLERCGWTVVARNARTRYGELDLIALDGAALVFVEVKTLRGGGGPRTMEALAAIGPRKQRQIRCLARAWLAESRPRLRYREIRFDAIGVTVGAGPEPMLEHVEAAF